MSQLAELLEELDFESWLDYEGVRYKLTRGKSGIQAQIRECPSCGNTKWKVYFGIETGLGNCFVCERKFTKWKFISDHLAVSNFDTARYIENYMGQQGWRPRQTTSAPVTANALILPESHPIPINGKNLKYLQNRNITTELAQYFHLHYCHSGFFKHKDVQGRDAFQDYSKRVIIPIFDINGELINFQGRDVLGTAEQKYLFPPGFASTGSVLYNSHNAKKAVRVVIGEGAFDCFAIKAAMDGDKVLREFAALASFGKKLSYDQIIKLRELKDSHALKEVVIMWDAEPKAIESAVNAGLELRKIGIPARLALLPAERDPNEVPPDVVNAAIWQAKTIDPVSAIQMKLAAQRL